MLPVSCPACGAMLPLSDEMVGQQVRCGGCQKVFVVPAPPPRRPRSREEDDEDDRPRRRPARRDEDDEDDRPTRRQSRRDDDYGEDDEDDRPRKKKRRKKRTVAPGKPGLAIAAAILFLIWGGVGAVVCVWAIVGLISVLNVVANVSVMGLLFGLVQVVLAGCFAAYLIVSGLKILNGEAEDLAAIGTAVLSVIGFVLLLSVALVAFSAPAFAFTIVVYQILWALVLMSGAIVGAIFCLVCARKYEKWQRS